MLFRLAYTLGNTSPNNKIRKVTKITSTINFKIGIEIVAKTVSNEKEKRITMAICKKLLATKMVANNFLGFPKSWLMIIDLEALFLFSSTKSFAVRENMATSAAATIAQQKSKRAIPMVPKSMLVSIVDKNPKLGSGSKCCSVS